MLAADRNPNRTEPMRLPEYCSPAWGVRLLAALPVVVGVCYVVARLAEIVETLPR